MIYSPELRSVAERVIWFESPEESLRFTKRFLAYVMTYATLEEILVVKQYFSDEDFKAALIDPVPGIFDPPSWSYWNLVYRRDPIPPLPQRSIPA